jgi:CNT family concentrative nucleoside transporter
VIGFATAANIFLGMIESPLAIRPYLSRLSRSEMFVIMTTGMATVAGTVMAIYATLLHPTLPGAALHILTASFMAAPGSILVARLMIPETQESVTKVDAYVGEEYSSTIQAFATGVEEGVKIFFNVIGMLIAATAVVALANIILGAAPDVLGAPLSIERLFGWVLAPLAWIMGVPWAECGQAGGLMGIKAVLNELIAYIRLSEIPADVLSERTRIIMTYALCGFANFAGAAVMVGGLSSVCPERRGELGALGMKSILSGILTTSITGALAGAFYGLGG